MMTKLMPHENEESIIDVRNVSKMVPTAAGNQAILSAVSLRVHSGEFVGIVGPSGSGKSTLLNVIAGIDRPSAGEIFIGKQKINSMNENQLARWRGRNLGIIFQFFQLIPTLSVIENVILPMVLCKTYRRYMQQEKARTCLQMVDMLPHINKMPSLLSAGEQQRVAIARALVNDPSVLIADEPTGNLDSGNSIRIFSLFKQLSIAGKTILMVTHDRDLAAQIPRVISILDGKISVDSAEQPGTSVLESRHYECAHK